MSKTAVIADVHLSGFQTDAPDSSNLPKRLGTIISSVKYVLDYCKQHDINRLEIAGDLIHDKSVIYTEALTAFSECLMKNSHDNLHIFMIPGNHDMSSTGHTQRSAVEVFKSFPNVTVITNPVCLNGRFYLPWSHSIYEDLKNYSSHERILISHFGLNEARLQSGLSVKTHVTMKELSKFELVILGHYHLPQHISNERTNLYYTGSVCHRDWNDKGEQKRFLVYDDSDLSVESVPFIGFPEYKEFVIDKKEDIPNIVKLAEKAKQEGHTIRIKKNIQDSEPISINDVQIIEKKEDVDITNRGVSVTQTDSEKIDKYIEIKKVDPQNRSKYIEYLSRNNIMTNLQEAR